MSSQNIQWKKMKYNLEQRICSLYSADYAAVIDPNKVLKFIYSVGEPSIDRNQVFLKEIIRTGENMRIMKELLRCPQTEHTAY